MMQAQDDNEVALDVSEISLEAAQQILLTDETLSDVTLEGTDGIPIHTSRNILATRSRVFRTMLFGKSAEAKSSIIKINYKGTVIRCLVEYCVTDNVSLFHEMFDENPSDIVFALAGAARFFDLPLLQKKILNHAFSKANKDLQLACSLYEEARNKNEGHDDVQKMLLCSIHRNPEKALLEGDALFSMKPSSLEEILSGDKIQANELTLFNILKRWVMVNDEEIPETSEGNSETRREIGTRLIQYIGLTQITPSDLINTVSPSDLVPAQDLKEIYTLVLLKVAESTFNLDSLNKPRYNQYKWRRSQSDVCKNTSDYLDHGVLKSGIHEWSIRVLTRGTISSTSPFVVGVGGLIKREFDNTYMANGCCWGYSVTGNSTSGPTDRSHQLLKNLPEAREGSVVKLTLDLTKQDGLNGALYVAIDGGPRTLVFTNLFYRYSDDDQGFYPAVSLNENDGCRFLGFASDERYI